MNIYQLTINDVKNPSKHY